MKTPPIEELIPSIDPKNPPPEAWRLAEQIAAGEVDESEPELLEDALERG